MELTIPLFPCKSLRVTVDFYQILGFEVSHYQEEPYFYTAVQRGDIQIHFNKLSVWKSKNGVCLVMVSDVAAYHKTFADALRTRCGSIPVKDYPRITRFRSHHTRFHVFDPSGNTLIFIDQNEGEKAYSWSSEPTSALDMALQNAAFLRDTYCTDEVAATVLDKALAKYPHAPPLDRARVLAARAELALALGESDRVTTCRAALNQISLSVDDRQRYAGELRAADDLERWLTQPTD